MKRGNRLRLTAVLVTLAALLTGCMSGGAGEDWTPSEDVPKIPEKLEKSESAGMPTLSVYNVKDKSTSEMDVETYVMGVVAGEMKNDWPLEALKAQAILARTFTLKFCQDKSSKYEGADISTDVTEAQAYAAGDVNERVRQAVNATRGQAMAYNGEYPYAWFHAHSGGMTELPSAALDYEKDDPEYLKPVRSRESGKAPDEVKHWTATFTKAQVLKACADTGVKLDRLESIEVGEKGASGRARTLLVNGKPVSAPSFRLQIGANRLKSALIEAIEVEGNQVTFKGRGFGHGVGMSQWGAYAMAESGKTAEDIIHHYFSDVNIVKLW